MKWNLTAWAAAAMAAVLAGPAFAQGDGDVQAREKVTREVDRANRDAARNNALRGAGPEHRFHRGDRLPAHYHRRDYVVEDWRRYHLHEPPRGHHWVRVGNDYVLVAIATGVIAELMLNK